MEYIELRCFVGPNNSELADQLIAVLGQYDFESFNEEGEEILAYIQTAKFDASILDNMEWPPSWDVKYSWKVIPEQNWNAVWEENFQPVTISNRCHIRAPFHPSLDEYEYQIIIEPKMSFGTAHHETTALMIEHLLEMNLEGKVVLDMGSGTGVLAILAAMKGAADVTAIDNDTWAYENAKENVERNNTPYIHVYLGDASMLGDKKFDIIIANINRNILLADMPSYCENLNEEGVLLMSGFYNEDLDSIKHRAESLGMKYISCKEKNRWVAAYFLNK